MLVDSGNLAAYVQAVVDATLGAGVEAQMAAFREGFNEVRALSTKVLSVCNSSLDRGHVLLVPRLMHAQAR